MSMMDALAFVSVGLLGMGVVFSHRDKHLFRFAGYILFGIFWLLRAPQFSGDAVNTMFSVLALPFFAVVGMEEYRIYGGRKGKPGVDMLAGGVFLGSLIYFMVAKVPVFSGVIITLVTEHSTMLVNLFSEGYVAGAVEYPGPLWYTRGFMTGSEVTAPIYAPDGGVVVRIVTACTGLQSMMVFAGPMLYTTRTPWLKKGRAVLAIVPIIYVLNLVRNAGIILMLEQGYSFYFAHDIVGKAGSLAALLLLAFLAFKMVPGLLDDVDDVISLFIRRKPRSPPSKPSPPPGESPPE